MASVAVATHEDCLQRFFGVMSSSNRRPKIKRGSDIVLPMANFREIGPSDVRSGAPFFEAASDDSSSLNRKSMSLNAEAGRGLWEMESTHRNGYSGLQRSSSLVLHGDSRISLTELTRAEKSNLRRKLRRELDVLRILSCKIEARESQIRSQSLSAGLNPSFSDAQFSGNDARSCPGREVTSHRTSTPVGKSVPAFRDVGFARQNSLTVADGRSFGADLSLKEKRTPKANQLYHSSEFLMGKDKMPVGDKLKAKPNPGSKRGAPSVLESREKKRPAVDPSHSRQRSELLRQCGNLLKRLMQHKHAWVFKEPVDPVKLGLSDYFTVIKRPMDLGTIRGKLSRSEYGTPLLFAEDVRLTFCNAMTYNPPTNDVYAMADVLSKLFEEKWRVIEEKYGEESRTSLEVAKGSRLLPAPVPSFEKFHPEEVSDQSQVRSKKSIPSSEVAAVIKAKPKTEGKAKRGMSYQEKKKLSANMGLLPVDKLEEIVPLMKARNPNLVQKGDEIIVDVETFDNETLWELNRFVTNSLKNLGKNKKGIPNANPPTNQDIADASAENATSKARKGDVGDEDVDIDDDLPDASFPPVVIDKDGGYVSRSSSSGSSSSDTGSSSDSDSGSSSGSDSDGEDAHSADRRH